MSVLFVTGTGTEIGKTVTTAAIAAAALARGRSVAVLKPAQTGVTAHEPGDVAEVERLAGAPVLVVAQAGLGTLNTTALTALALRSYGLDSPGVVIGSWPAEPDLASRCNLADLPDAAGAPLLGLVPEGSAGLAPHAFRTAAPDWLAPALGGSGAFRIPA
jgi:dethiobiotin synthetase